MDHAYIEEENLADRYVLGTLTAQERAQFEEHFIDCPECQGRLENSEQWQQALKGAVAESASGGIFAWWTRLETWKRVGVLIAASVLVAIIPVAITSDWTKTARTQVLPATLPTFALSQTRGLADESVPATRINVPAGSEWVVLSVEKGGDSSVASYRASLVTASAEVVWTASELQSSSPDVLALTLPARLLRRGGYTLLLEGRTTNGKFVRLGQYAFAVA